MDNMHILWSCVPCVKETKALVHVMHKWHWVKQASNQQTNKCLWPIFSSSLLRSQLDFCDLPFLVRFLRMWSCFNLTVEVVTFHLHG